MTYSSLLIREKDGKRFKVSRLAHWSEIRSDDGEKDIVKWLGADEYISQNKGFKYYLNIQGV